MGHHAPLPLSVRYYRLREVAADFLLHQQKSLISRVVRLIRPRTAPRRPAHSGSDQFIVAFKACGQSSVRLYPVPECQINELSETTISPISVGASYSKLADNHIWLAVPNSRALQRRSDFADARCLGSSTFAPIQLAGIDFAIIT